MRNKTYVISILTLVVCLIGSAALAGGLKDRIRARVPAINSLKAQGVVGESNVGLLEYISVKQEIEVVRSENADRLIVYKAIAQKTGTTVNVVGQRRAAKIAQKAPSGTWLQGADGKWYQK